MRIAYLSNLFPTAVEPYVASEMEELRRRGVEVIACSVRRPKSRRASRSGEEEPTIYFRPVGFLNVWEALVLAIRRWNRTASILARAITGGERITVRVKAIAHTFLGAYCAVLLQKRRVSHIHVHHGYFASWIAMTAAALLEINYSMTLHGSDLLLRRTYLGTKLHRCKFCLTISEYNREFAVRQFAELAEQKISVVRLGVDVPTRNAFKVQDFPSDGTPLKLLSVGRLHAVKDHAFLISACGALRDEGVDFTCRIAGEGPERQSLETAIRRNGLEKRVILLGHIDPGELDGLYRDADAIVLTSRSEGIPLVLMEAMARGKIVIAPAITGIPELVIGGRTGFLYKPAELTHLTNILLFVQQLSRWQTRLPFSRLDWIGHAARTHVLHNFDRRKNLEHFSEKFLALAASA